MNDLESLAKDLGATIDARGMAPDGSGWATMSMPLPADHWSTKHNPEFETPPMPFRMGEGPLRDLWAANIRDAARYAYRASTMQGRELDLDPDALVQNFVIGMLGYWTPDGISSDTFANPTPLPASYEPFMSP